MNRPQSKPRVTMPAPKYGLTEIYGDCEHQDCHHPARLTCSTCAAHVCRDHAAHDTHIG